MQSVDVTEGALIGALEQARRDSESEGGWMTTEEITEEMGASRHKVLQLLKKMKKAGRLEMRRVARYNILDELQRIPGYRIKAKEG